MHLHSLIRSRWASGRWGFLGLAALLSGALFFGACADDDGADDDIEVTDTVTATSDGTTDATSTEAPSGTATATETETATETITPAEPVEREGISFLAPEGWVGNAETWTSPDGNVTLLFATAERETGAEPEAVMLPEGATNLDREEIDTPLGPGALHTIEMADEDIYERHAIVPTEDRIYDWWLAGESIEQLDEHQDALEGVLDSILREEDD